jgi:hypothetical protein
MAVYRERLININPIHDNCPTTCARFPNKTDDEYCNNCDVKIAKDSFKEETLTLLDKQFGSKWKSYTFEALENQVLNILAIKDDDPDHWTTMTTTLVNILSAEFNKQERIKLWEERQKLKNARKK